MPYLDVEHHWPMSIEQSTSRTYTYQYRFGFGQLLNLVVGFGLLGTSLYFAIRFELDIVLIAIICFLSLVGLSTLLLTLNYLIRSIGLTIRIDQNKGTFEITNKGQSNTYELKDITSVEICEQRSAGLYGFSFGLSYTKYQYSNLLLENETIKTGEKLNLKIDIENTGAMDGKEAVQVYVRDVESSVERPIKELKDFKKVNIAAGDKQTVYFTLTDRDFAFWDIEREDWKVEPGQFEILVGAASNNILASAKLEITND
ncbi:MAG: hypothetical protein ACJA2C_001815 [Marinoscillum sp.]|jgi:hypothetical protein